MNKCADYYFMKSVIGVSALALATALALSACGSSDTADEPQPSPTPQVEAETSTEELPDDYWPSAPETPDPKETMSDEEWNDVKNGVLDYKVAQDSSVIVDAPTYKEISAANGTVVIDIRLPEEYEMGHIPGSLNLPIGVGNDQWVTDLTNSVEKDAVVAVYCKSDVRSARAANMAKDAGYEYVYDLEGGINAWTDAGYELE